MALTLNLKVDRITSDGRIYLEDITGNYHVTDNPGGYGSPNLARVAVALFCFPLLKKEAEDIDLVVTANTPTSVLEFEVSGQDDGWVEFTVIGLQVFADSIVDDRFDVGEYTYDTATQEIRKILTSTLNLGVYTYTYEVITDKSEILDQETYVATVNYLYINEICELMDKARDKYLSSFSIQPYGCAKVDNQAKEKLLLMKEFLQGAVNDFGKLAYYEAEKKIEWIYNVYEHYNCD